MKRRGFITRILAALGLGLSTGIRPASVEGEAGVPDAPPAPPTDLLAGRCYACLDTGRVYERGTGGVLPCHVCSGTPCPTCRGTGQIYGLLVDNKIVPFSTPTATRSKCYSWPCPRCSVPVTHYPRRPV